MAHQDDTRQPSVVREPTVYLIGRQQVDAAELARFLRDHGVSWATDTSVAGEHLCEIAGRVCYMSFAKPRPGGNKAYLAHILEVGHGSVLEHAVWNFIFTGISRSCTHELVRHRAGWAYCLTGDTLIYSDHFTRGKREGVKKRPLRQLYEMTKTPHGRSRLRLLRLRCLDEATGTFTRGKVARIAYSGVKPVFTVELENGKTITCSRDHRFLTPEGWLPLHEILGGLEVSPGGLTVRGARDLPIATSSRELEYAERLGAATPDVAALAGRTPPRARPRLLAPKFVRVRSVTYAGEQDTYDIEMEGPHHNFVANGIVTHNSQLSQRYVDESQAEFVEPQEIAADADLHHIWLDNVSESQEVYKRLVEKLTEAFQDVPDRTLRRKMARQAARSVLPNATETKIFVSANARALRHFIEMRASRHAETEIRKLAVQLVRIMQREAPNLFGDYELVPLPDGTFEVVTPHRKV